ncbi:MAG: transglycosylase SLT domain-containing protein [Bdellovibrionaceae bacterium]|nr:transglycosylase SLT domain-containing protein [Pseudobdellovibrionaceae bacterium]
MHGSQVNPRYFLCTGWKESRFNPGAVGSNGDKGMFQVMPATGKAALRYKSLIPGFQNMSGQQFMSKMVNSTLAQTELSYLTLKMKVAEGVSKRVLDGTGSVNDYQTLAYRYNGQGPRARRYSRHISMCYSCLLHAMPNTSEFNSNSVENCLGKADY